VRTRQLPCGDSAVLIEVASIDDVLALQRSLRDEPVAGVEDLVPGARTLLVVASSPRHLPAVGERVAARAEGLDAGPGARVDGPVIEVGVDYDGPDLGEVASLTGLSPEEVVAAHTGMPWTVAFAGFAPGFAYLVGGDPRLEVPRRADPRERVPAGAVGLAGQFSGIYPRESPGGWQLIGRTSAVLWDLDRDPPALLVPGARVRFTAGGGG
jgi:KipI family sensor histidine kinase inhibitor